MTNVLIEIVDGVYPTMVFSKDKYSAAHCKVEKEQLKRWKADIKAYQQTQKEMLDAVNHYEPARVAALKKGKAGKHSTE